MKDEREGRGGLARHKEDRVAPLSRSKIARIEVIEIDFGKEWWPQICEAIVDVRRRAGLTVTWYTRRRRSDYDSAGLGARCQVTMTCRLVSTMVVATTHLPSLRVTVSPTFGTFAPSVSSHAPSG